MFIGQLVLTPYGEGEILNINNEHITIQPTNWLLAQNQKPKFYINLKDVQPKFSIGSVIKCSFGEGLITSIRDKDGIYVIKLNNWKLADGKSPILYLNQSSITMSDIEKKNDKPIDKCEDSLEKSLKLKNEGNENFKKSNILEARLNYMQALETLQLVKGDLSNLQKSQLFEQTVTCNNNVALCCIRLKEYQLCIEFATNSLALIKSLEKNIPNSQIWKCLLQNNITIDKLQKEWKKKSHFYIGKAELCRKNFEEAVQHLTAALNLIIDDKTLSTNISELKQLLTEAKTKRNAVKKKEQNMWENAFKKDSDNNSPSPKKNIIKNNLLPTTDLPTDFKFDLNNLKKDVKDNKGKDKKPSKSNNKNSNSIWPKDNFNQFTILFGLGFLGLVGGVAYMWMKNKRYRS